MYFWELARIIMISKKKKDSCSKGEAVFARAGMQKALGLKRFFSSKSQRTFYDALIIGAGPTGGAMACALGKQNVRSVS
jgi:NADPH-dependent 2,4-dienoyl-CoA reductase/sulfur reductase-like enzyme